jgi:xanthine dehydrogenase accessory factor
MKAELLEQILQDRRDKRPVVLATTLPTGEQDLLYPQEPAPEGVAPELFDAARSAAARDQSITIDLGGASIFLSPFNPPLRLVVVGAVHVAQPLSQMAALAGFEVVVVDPRAAFSTEARFPGVTRVTTWPDKALAELRLDRRTAVVTLTHDPKLDDPALETALRSDAFYVGCLGSGKTHASRLERLKKRGFTEAELARLFGPVGLRIGARTPAEIAVSILAQVVVELRKA